jgi:predicted Zn-dependent peptidase
LNGYDTTTLDNGITVVTENIPHVKSFSLGFWFDTGSINETAGNNGISHFIEHMLFKGTNKRSAKKISEEVESLGGYLNAFTSKEHTCYYGRGLSQHLDKTFAVVADMIQNSLFRKSDITKEAGVIVDELLDIEDSPEELIFDKFESNLYSGNKLHYPIIGTAKNIKSFGKEDIINYMKKYYVFNNLYVVASGMVDHNRVMELVEKHFTRDIGNHNSSRKNVKVKKAENIFIKKNTQQTHVVIGRSSYGYKSKHRLAASLLSHILGEGSSSRLFQTLRERNGITYQVNSFLNSFYDVSSFGVYFSTNQNSVNKALKLVYREFEKLSKKPVGAAELKRAKEYIKGNIFMSLEYTTNRMMRLAQSIIYFNRIKSLEETVTEIDAIDRDELFELSKKIFDLKKYSQVIISPAPL